MDCGIQIEPERYELFEAPTYHFDFARREFIASLGGLVVLVVGADSLASEAGAGRGGFGGGAVPQDVGAWIHIGEDGAITAHSGKVEVGQGARTELTQVVAEELRVAPDRVRMVMSDTDLVPFDAGTFGSGTTPRMVPQLRRAAAAAREALLDLAAEQLKCERGALVVADGRIAHAPTKQSLPFGQLTKGHKSYPTDPSDGSVGLTKSIAGDIPTTPPDQWRVQGKPLRKVNAKDIVGGKHKYASDVKRPGMMFGAVLRGPLGATLTSLDMKPAEAMPGVTVVRDGDFVGVAAPTEHEARQAVAAMRAEWSRAPMTSHRDLFAHLKQTAQPSPPNAAVTAALSQADHRIAQTYSIAYIAHAPLEPRAAVAEWSGSGPTDPSGNLPERLTVWTGTQRPFGVKGDLASALRIASDRVRVIVPDTGSGYGGKHTVDTATEAARLAKAVGKPVKVVWTREEEFTYAYFRPAGVIEVAAGVTSDGTLVAWDFHNYNSGGSAIRSLYEVPNQVAQFHGTRSPLRQGSYRALAATANHFARESAMDDLAHLAKMDPLAFRLKNLKEPRLRAVLEAACEKFGWGKTKAKDGRGFGLACGSEKGSYVANCVEVAIENGKPRVVRAVTAFECGAIINPENLRNQVEGSVVMGIGGALFEAIEFADGKILNPRFSQYRVPRFSDTPPLETVLLDRKDLPSAGAGETPIVTIAPAIGNAMRAATGKRLTAMPMTASVIGES